MTSELSFQFSILKKPFMPILIALLGTLNVFQEIVTIRHSYAVSFHTKEVSLAVAIVHFPLYFYHSPLADPEHIPIASNLENFPRDV